MIDILLWFRTYKYVDCADIMKMYRVDKVDKEHRPLQRILWRKFTYIFELNTVTYSTSAALYLAIKCLKTLGKNYGYRFPKASNVILKDFYVDDLLTGSNDLAELCDICSQISTISHYISGFLIIQIY